MKLKAKGEARSWAWSRSPAKAEAAEEGVLRRWFRGVAVETRRREGQRDERSSGHGRKRKCGRFGGAAELEEKREARRSSLEVAHGERGSHHAKEHHHNNEMTGL